MLRDYDSHCLHFSNTVNMVAFAGIDLIKQGVKPRKNLLQPPSSRYSLIAQSIMFVNLRLDLSESSDCILDLMTSVG